MKDVNPKAKLYFPYWANRISKTANKNIQDLIQWKYSRTLRKEISIGSGSSCVIAELHNWTHDYLEETGYECGDCVRFANSLYSLAKGGRTEWFLREIDMVVEHVEESHQKIVGFVTKQ